MRVCECKQDFPAPITCMHAHARVVHTAYLHLYQSFGVLVIILQFQRGSSTGEWAHYILFFPSFVENKFLYRIIQRIVKFGKLFNIKNIRGN